GGMGDGRALPKIENGNGENFPEVCIVLGEVPEVCVVLGEVPEVCAVLEEVPVAWATV
ncbi:hypothetical protein AVEN_220650-1, partial [Araneus ventricosus]